MGRSLSASYSKGALEGRLDGVVQGSFTKTISLNSAIQGELSRSVTLDAHTALYVRYIASASLNSNIDNNLPPDAVSYWKLDGNSLDFYGTNNGADTAITYAAGKIGQAAVFNGSTSKINLGASNTLELSDVSISAWVNITNTATYRMIFTRVTGNGLSYTNSYELFVDTTGKLSWYGNATPYVVGATALPTGSWIHIVATRSATGACVLYVNGSVHASGTTSPPVPSTASVTYIGGRNQSAADGNLYSFNGMIDEVGLWGRVLTPTEVTVLYNSGSGIQLNYSLTNSTKLLRTLHSYWTLDANSNDSKGNYIGTDTAMSYVSGKVNNAGSFNGTTSKIVAGVVPLDSNNWSMSIWFYSTTNTGRMFTYYGAGPTFWTQPAYNMQIVHSGVIDFDMGFVIPLNVWTHVVVTRNNNIITAYKNGIQTAQNTAFGTVYASDTSVVIGNSPAYNEPHSGLLDEAAIWGRALTSAEVAILYNSGIGYQLTPISRLTRLLLEFEGSTPPPDLSQYKHPVYYSSGAAISSAAYKFGTQSLRLSGGGASYVGFYGPESNHFLGTKDFTIDFWINFVAIPPTGNGWAFMFSTIRFKVCIAL